MVDDDAVALPKPLDARARPRHRPADLVAEHARAGQEALHDLLDVGAADAAGVDPDQHLARADLGDGDLLDPQVALPPVDRGAHGHKDRSYRGCQRGTARCSYLTPRSCRILRRERARH